MSGIMTNIIPPKSEIERADLIFKVLLNNIKECQKRFGGRSEIATEENHCIQKLCDSWEACLSHGLRSNSSVLKNVTEKIGGHSTDPVFWQFAFQHLTAHEKERFQSLRNIWTDRGRSRALIRAALNERSLERYVLIWLSDQNLQTNYEPWALMRDNEKTHLLHSMAAGLSSILFAISVDKPELNGQMTKTSDSRTEPIIAAPVPVKPTKKATKIKRPIISIEDPSKSTFAGSYSSNDSMSFMNGISSSNPNSLPSLCLKYESPASNEYQITKNIETDEKDVPVVSVQGMPETPSSIHYISFPTAEKSEESFKNSVSSRNSSMHDDDHISTCSSNESENDVTILKLLLLEKEEKCAQLEARVAELSLENCRLRNSNSLSNSSRTNSYTVSIPHVFLQKSSRRKFYAYEIHVIMNSSGDCWKVLRRYSEFFKLHQLHQKENISVKTLDFPPKKKFGNFDAHFVEQRRQRLQVYLRHLITILPEVASCTTRSQLENLFPFLKC